MRLTGTGMMQSSCEGNSEAVAPQNGFAAATQGLAKKMRRREGRRMKNRLAVNQPPEGLMTISGLMGVTGVTTVGGAVVTGVVTTGAVTGGAVGTAAAPA